MSNSFTYLCHLQRLFNDYEKLQQKYATLRQQFNERKISTKHEHHSFNDNNNKTVDDLKMELECEKALVKSLKAEVCHLLKEARKSQDRYSDLIAISKVEKQPVDRDHTADAQLNEKLKEIETENKNLKENLEFITSENGILSDSLKDLEETIFKERKEWIEDKNKYEEVVTWSKSNYEKLKSAESCNDDLRKNIESHKAMINEFESQIEIFDSFLSYIHELLENNIADKHQLQEANSSEVLDRSIKVQNYKNLLQDIIKSKNIENNSTNGVEKDSSLKFKLSTLHKEIDSLNETNKCLQSENEELKRMLNENNVSVDQVNSNLEIVKLKEQLKHKEEMVEKISQKFARHRAVYEANEKKSTEEFEKLDNLISLIIDKVNSLPIEMQKTPEMEEILKLFNIDKEK